MSTAVETLKNSGVILTPTDTTFGLNCAAFDLKALHKINQIKNRPEDKNFILLVENEAHLQQLVEVPDLAWDLIDLSEKPITLIYDQILNVPDFLISPQKTIAIRLINYLPLKKIITKIKQPLASTSANLSGESTPKNFEQISTQIKENVDFIMPECHHFIPQHSSSSIVQIKHNSEVKIIRE